VLIAMALANRPRLLIADEPTTALDVTVQAQILALLVRLQRRFEMGLLLITHDLPVVAEVADRVAVMYAGQIVETAPGPKLFRSPRHPYTRGLLASVPSRRHRGGTLPALEGSVPGTHDRPAGCRFEPRCPERLPECRLAPPPVVEVAPNRTARCVRLAPELPVVNPVCGEGRAV
jgi:oligopeptide/dipeptide ABC transporter ATP-binding protein